ncbi:MAG: hypothetical protein M3292_00695 [Actinomycetota bacterium]|nr:hypothetical protein [Actinomycetota bacterium]
MELSDLPDGFSILTLIDSTSSGMSPIFALEENGARNLLTLSGGNYWLSRTFDYGRYGGYTFNYEIRTSGTRVTSTGVQEGTLELPPLEGTDISGGDPLSGGAARASVFHADHEDHHGREEGTACRLRCVLATRWGRRLVAACETPGSAFERRDHHGREANACR